MRFLGHDFGRTPMGVEQVGARHTFACCGDPSDCDGPCSDERANICICDPELLELDVCDGSCPKHGLVSLLKAIVAGDVDLNALLWGGLL